MKPTRTRTLRECRLPVVEGLFLLLGFVFSPTIGLAEAESSSPMLDPVTTEVIEMLLAGVDEGVIVHWLESTGRRPLDIGSQGVIALTEAGASEELMTTLLKLLEGQDAEAAQVEPVPAALPPSGEAAGIQTTLRAPRVTTEGAVEAVFRLSAKQIWTDEDEPDRPRDRPWDIYLYLDGELVAWTRPTLQGELVETHRVIQSARRELRVILQRYEKLRGGWFYESLAVPTLVAFEARPGDPIEIAVEMKRLWGLWRQRKDGGPLSFVVRKSDQILAENPGTGGDPDRWNPVCEDVEANFPDSEKVPARFRNPMSRCIRWADLWTGAGQSTSRGEILAKLAQYDFQPPVR